MLLENLFKKLIAPAIACLIISPALLIVSSANGQIVSSANGQKSADRPPQPANPASLTADGQLTGNIMVAEAAKVDEVPVATVSLVSQGKVIDSVKSDAAGVFSFANVQPGPYQVVGTAQGLVGSQALQVAPFANSDPVTSSRLILQQPVVTSYNTYSNVPLSTISSSPATIGYAGGGGRVLGGRLGGRLGGGVLRSPRGLLLIGGIVGGLAAIDDSSPDQ